MDRVDGMWLGQSSQQRDSEAARAAVLKLLQSTPANAGAPVKVALAEAAARLKIEAAVPTLVAQFRSDTSDEVRVAALRALQVLEAPVIGELMKTAAADGSANVRRAALGLLATVKLSDAEKVQNLVSIVRSGAAPDQQAAFEVLGTLKVPEAQAALGTFFDELVAGKIAAPVQVDLVDAMQTNRTDALDAKLEAYRKSKSADTLAAAFRDALLVGGNARRGRDVFVEQPAAQCTRCHAIGDSGGPQVGPNLQGLATRLTREQILESLLEPNARITAGYGTVSVTLKNGQKMDGTLREETATHLVIVAGTPPAEQRVAKTEIAQRTDPVSAMPPMGAILKPREIRDLLAGLSTLK